MFNLLLPAAGEYRLSMWHRPYKNGQTDQGAVWDGEWGGTKTRVLDGRAHSGHLEAALGWDWMGWEPIMGCVVRCDANHAMLCFFMYIA